MTTAAPPTSFAVHQWLTLDGGDATHKIASRRSWLDSFATFVERRIEILRTGEHLELTEREAQGWVDAARQVGMSYPDYRDLATACAMHLSGGSDDDG